MREDVGHLQARLAETIRAIGYVAENGDSIAILSVKKGMAHHMATLLKLKCQVPNPSHKLNIQLQTDPLLATQILPTTGRILIDGILHQPHQTHQPPLMVNGTHSSMVPTSHSQLPKYHSNHNSINLNHLELASHVRTGRSSGAHNDISISGKQVVLLLELLSWSTYSSSYKRIAVPMRITIHVELCSSFRQPDN